MREALCELVADEVHPMMRDGDPHTRAEAMTLADKIISLVVKNIDCETYRYYGYFCGFEKDDSD